MGAVEFRNVRLGMKDSPIIAQRLLLRVLSVSCAFARLFLISELCAAQGESKGEAKASEFSAAAQPNDASKNSKADSDLETASPSKDASSKDASSKDAVDSELIEARYKLGMLALSKNNLEGAITDLLKVLEWNASHLGALVNLGWIAQRNKDWVESEAYMRRAIAVSSDNPAVWLGLGLAVLEQSKLDAAVAAFAQVVALDPKNARGHRFFGLALGRRGWIQAAEEELRRSLEIEPDDAGAHFNLAVFYLQRNPVAIELARRHYYRALDLGFGSDPAIEVILKKAALQPTGGGLSEGLSGAEPVNAGAPQRKSN
jgi:tetratricopeptide (TPR) repeat protein